MNHTTRRYPRTLNQAFGPYCTPYIESKETDYPDWWWVSMAVISVVTAVIIVVTI